MSRKGPLRSTILSLCLLGLSATTTAAGDEIDLIKLMPLTDLSESQRLESEFSALVEKGDSAGIQRLASRIEQADGEMMQQAKAIFEGGAKGDSRAALAIGPCHYAGYLVRFFAVSAAAGQIEPVFRAGTVMIDDNPLDDLFSENMARCERLSKQAGNVRKIGTSCVVAGVGCDIDPDMKE